LARQFEPSARAIRNWVKQAALNAGERPDGLTTEERDELRPLRLEVHQLREERARDPLKSRGLVCTGDQYDPVQGFEFVTGTLGRPSGRHHMPRAGRLPRRATKRGASGRCPRGRGLM